VPISVIPMATSLKSVRHAANNHADRFG
jgi:hypothetical protein